MTGRTDTGEVAASEHRQARTWRALVAMQLAVIGVILLSLLVIFLVGVLASYFSQRTL